MAHTLKRMPSTSTPPQGAGSASRTTMMPDSSMPQYAAPKKLTPTSGTRARIQNTYHTMSAKSSARLTYSAPFNPRKNTLTGYSMAAMMPSISFGSFASWRSM